MLVTSGDDNREGRAMSVYRITTGISAASLRREDAPIVLRLAEPYADVEPSYASGYATETGASGDLTMYMTGGLTTNDPRGELPDSHPDYAPGQ